MRTFVSIQLALVCLLFSDMSRAADWPSYYTTNIQGWQIHVDKALVDNKDQQAGLCASVSRRQAL